MLIPDLNGQRYGMYEIEARLGSSSIGTVYRAVQRETGQKVALRLLDPDSDSQRLQRFLDELEQLAALKHPYLVPILDFGAVDNTIYVAMQLFTGGTLRQRWQRCKNHEVPLPSLGEIDWLLDRLAVALDYAHSEGVAHYHIETRNILFDSNNDAYLSDLGVTKLFKVAYALRSTGSVATHKYSPPEQWIGENMTAASDQYTVAAIVYLLITRHDVFEAPTIAGLMHKHLNEMVVPPHYYRGDAPAQLVVPLVRAMAKQPEQRYPSVSAFAQAFHEVIQGREGEPTGFFALK